MPDNRQGNPERLYVRNDYSNDFVPNGYDANYYGVNSYDANVYAGTPAQQAYNRMDRWCPPCPPCSGRPYPGGPKPERPYPGESQPERPYPGGSQPERPYPYMQREVVYSGQKLDVKEQEQKMEDDLYMTDEPEREEMEKDWLYMKQRYPNEARRLQRYVDDALDQLEYESSMMFDEYPDQTAIDAIVRDIIEAVQENEPALLRVQEGEENAPDATWSPCVKIMIQVMVLSEMHHRRWRYSRMRRRNY